jgi:hypothetical protein
MSSSVEQQVIYQIANAPMREHPFPHLFVESVFPADFYARLRSHWVDTSSLVCLGESGRVSPGSYPERFILPLTPDEIEKLPPGRREFWVELADWLLGPRFLDAVMLKFARYVRGRFGERLDDERFFTDALVVRDLTNYSLGPHTDTPQKVLALVFYCPDNADRPHLGTSVYVPNQPEFRCKGDTHHEHSLFTRVATMAYRPNCLFAFFKTERSFHGVERITDSNVERDLLLYDVRVHHGAARANAKVPGLGARMLRSVLASKVDAPRKQGD